MKVPLTTTTTTNTNATQQLQQSVSTKPVHCNTNANSLRNTNYLGSNTVCYEPKSVLDPRRSPSPTAAEKPPNNTDNTASKAKISAVSDILLSHSEDNPLQLDDQVLNYDFHAWDSESLMRELGLHDETPVATQFNHFHSETHFQPTPPELQPQSFNPYQFLPSDFILTSSEFHSNIPENFNIKLYDNNDHDNYNQDYSGYEFDFVDELIRVAECLETNSIQLAQVILARLNQQLRNPVVGKPLQRASFYFKEALQSLLTGSNKNRHSSSEIVQTIEAFKTFSNISPIVKFSSFTTNQAILEAVDGAMLVHAIDFDIGFGCHWPSFIMEVADKADSRKSNPPVIRITAVVPEEYGLQSRLIKENLVQFARDVNISFEIDFVSIPTFELLSFKAVKFVQGESTAVVLSPSIFRRVGPGLLNDLRRVSPHVIVHVDNEGLMGGGGPPSFRQTVIDGLEFYTTVLESLEANLGGGGGGDWIRKIEVFVLLPKILAAVEGVGRGGATPWRESLAAAAGIRPVELSQFADFQAQCLLRRVQFIGFQVAKRQNEMVLCWHDRPLIATSACRCYP